MLAPAKMPVFVADGSDVLLPFMAQAVPGFYHHRVTVGQVFGSVEDEGGGDLLRNQRGQSN